MKNFFKGFLLATVSMIINDIHAGPLDGPEIAGEWSSLYNGDVVAVHMVMMPTGKVLTYAEGGQGRPLLDEIRIWDPIELTLTMPELPPYDLFCSGHSVLPDGRVFIQGGHDEADAHGQSRATIYNPFTDTWDDTIPNMNAGRWYATSTILPNGDILVLNGAIDSYTNKNALPQIWQLQTNSWRNLVTAEDDAPMGLDFYPRMFIAPDGRAFKAGPDNDTWFLDTTGTGQWTRGPDMKWGNFRGYSAAVEFEEGRILVMGGGESPPTNTVELIDLNDLNPQWQLVAPMHHPRRHLNATIMADGKILVTSGTSAPGFNNGSGMVTIPEIYDPATNTWEEVAEQNAGRAYHSNAILLPDGRVLVGGGGRPAADGGIDNPNLEVYSPPYLFKGTRPEITNAPSTISFDQTFQIDVLDPEKITAVHFIRLGAATHSFDQTQSINRLDFTATATGLNIISPSNPNSTQPGHYMLFVLADGVPSVAKIIQFGDAEPPTSPTKLSSQNISPTQLTINWEAAQDNIKVVSYDVFLDGKFVQTVTETHLSISNLLSATDYTITVIARDLYGNESIASLPLKVRTQKPGLNEPTPVAGEDFMVAINQDFMLDGSQSSDIDGQLLTYEWVLDGNIVATTPIFQASQAVEGVYQYQINVSDGDFTVSDTVVVTVVTALNVVSNGDFELGMEAWYGEAHTGTATFSADDGRAHINVLAEGQNIWSTQIAQNINLVAGTTYTLDFDIQSDNPSRRFSVVVEEIGIWTPYLNKRLTLNKPVGEIQHFTLQWTQTITTNNAKIGFHVGAAGTADVWLDNVFLSGGDTENLAPIALAGSDLNGYLHFPVILNGSETFDPDPQNSPQSLTYSWQQTSGTPVSLSDNTIASPRFIPQEEGTYTFELTASDGEFSSTDTVSVTAQVLNNVPPIADAGITQDIALGRSIILDGSLSTDSDNAPLTLSYQWQQLTGPTIQLSDATAPSPTFTPTEVGSYTFGLIVFDGDEYSAPSLVTIRVAEVLTPNLLINGSFTDGLFGWQPLVLDDSIGTFSVERGELNIDIENSGINNWSLQFYQPMALIGGKTYTLKFDASAPVLPRTIRVVIEHDGSPFTGYLNQVLSIDAADTVETFTVQWTQPVDDSELKVGFHFGNSNNNAIKIDNVRLIDGTNSENIAPVVTAGLDQRAYIDTEVVLDASLSTDFDGIPSPLSYQWTQTEGPLVSLSDTTHVKPTFTPTIPGRYRFEVVANDGDLFSNIDDVIIIVTTTNNQAPTANAGTDRVMLVGNSINLNGTASFDIDNLPAPIRYNWQQIGGPKAVLTNNETATPTFTPVISGSYVFGLTVNDGDLSSIEETIIITVNEPNMPPVASAGDDRIAYLGDTVTLDGSHSIDPDSGPEPLTYMWAQASGPSVGLNISDPSRPTFIAAELGSYVFTLFVFDGEIISIVDKVIIDVVEIPNQAPVAMATAPVQQDVKTTITLDGSSTYDPDLGPASLTYNWQQISGPSVGLDNSTSAITQFTPTLPGNYIFKLVASDGTSHSNAPYIVPERSLLVTDKSILNHFPLKDVLQKMLNDSNDSNATPADIILDLADVRNNCNDFNNFPQHNSDDLPGFCSNPGASMDLFQAAFDTNLTYYRPIALINRFDLAGANNSDCGEYRIAYSGNDISPRVNFFIFEARLPNPNPEMGKAGCQPVLQYWADLSYERNVEVRAEKLRQFFFDGIAGFAPAIHVEHFKGENLDSGAIRLNARTDQQSNWIFMQFRTKVEENCAPLCNLEVEQEGLKDTPFPALAGDISAHPLASVFQEAVLAAIEKPGEKLLANTMTELSISLPIETYLGRQHSGLAQKEGVIEAMSPEFSASIQNKLNEVGSNLTPNHIITRVNALTCAGCHNQHSTELGAPLALDTAMQFAEFLSQIEENGPDGIRFKIKPAMETVFLPERATLLEQLLDKSTVNIVVNDIDSDGDQILDAMDLCPNSPVGAVIDATGCTLYIDMDNDNVPDERDHCLNSDKNTIVDLHGCKIIHDVLIEAEDYSSFKEKDRWKGYWKHYWYHKPRRCHRGVDVYTTFDEGNPELAVGCIKPGEKLIYEAELSAGLYQVSARVAAKNSNGAFKLKVKGDRLHARIKRTGRHRPWKTQVIGTIEVPAGLNKIKLKMKRGGFNLNWLKFEAIELYELDNDHDSVIDDHDQCPNTSPGIQVDSNGCPLS